MCNPANRKKIKDAGLRHWMVADTLGISEGTFCKMLRKELPEERSREVLEAIEKTKAV